MCLFTISSVLRGSSTSSCSGSQAVQLSASWSQGQWTQASRHRTIGLRVLSQNLNTSVYNLVTRHQCSASYSDAETSASKSRASSASGLRESASNIEVSESATEPSVSGVETSTSESGFSASNNSPPLSALRYIDRGNVFLNQNMAPRPQCWFEKGHRPILIKIAFFGTSTPSAIEWYMLCRLSISWPSDESWFISALSWHGLPWSALPDSAWPCPALSSPVLPSSAVPSSLLPYYDGLSFPSRPWHEMSGRYNPILPCPALPSPALSWPI